MNYGIAAPKKTSYKHPMTIDQWPQSDRPREKLLIQGALSLSDAELLAIFLRTGTRGKTAVDMARDLLNQYGSLRQLFAASLTDFTRTIGLGPAKYAQLQALLEMSRRHLGEQLQTRSTLDNSVATREYLKSKLRHLTHEVFACLFLDNRHRVLKYCEISHGTIDNAVVYPREVVKRALTENAAAVILAHNHPSGNPDPSSEDIDLTQRLIKALNLVDIRVLDHMIIGDQDITSLAEMGLMYA